MSTATRPAKVSELIRRLDQAVDAPTPRRSVAR